MVPSNEKLNIYPVFRLIIKFWGGVWCPPSTLVACAAGIVPRLDSGTDFAVRRVLTWPGAAACPPPSKFVGWDGRLPLIKVIKRSLLVLLPARFEAKTPPWPQHPNNTKNMSVITTSNFMLIKHVIFTIIALLYENISLLFWQLHFSAYYKKIAMVSNNNPINF